MKKLIRLRPGDVIPEGAQFIGTEEGFGDRYTSAEYKPTGLFGTMQKWLIEKRDPVTFYVYEVQIKENTPGNG